ncbi:MAG: TerB family tellurite resistance protein, partial [Pseudolabrys sp.]
LCDVLDNEGRQRTVKMMWQVIYVDERVSEFVSNIIWRTADLLGVSSRQRIELRQRVAVERASLNPV